MGSLSQENVGLTHSAQQKNHRLTWYFSGWEGGGLGSVCPRKPVCLVESAQDFLEICSQSGNPHSSRGSREADMIIIIPQTIWNTDFILMLHHFLKYEYCYLSWRHLTRKRACDPFVKDVRQFKGHVLTVVISGSGLWSAWGDVIYYDFKSWRHFWDEIFHMTLQVQRMERWKGIWAEDEISETHSLTSFGVPCAKQYKKTLLTKFGTSWKKTMSSCSGNCPFTVAFCTEQS